MEEWKIEEFDYGDEYWFGGPGQGCIEVGGWVNGGVKEDESAWLELQKEAHLIAAANELLNELRQSTEMLENIMEGRDWGSIEEKIIDNRAAIAKATGA